jgi:hypothetical protein
MDKEQAMREAVEALEWMRVAFKQGTQGRIIADTAIDNLKQALGPDILNFEILDKYDKVIYDSNDLLNKKNID